MRYLVILALATATVVAFAACGSITTKTVTTTTPAATATTPAPAPAPTPTPTTPSAPTPVGFQIMSALEPSVTHVFNTSPPITVQAVGFSCSLVDGTNNTHAICLSNIVGSTSRETRYVTISADGRDWADSAHGFPATATAGGSSSNA
jgi:hypothetical protein